VRVTLDATAIPASLTGVGRYVMEVIPPLCAQPDLELTLLTRRNDAARWPVGPHVEARAPRSRPLRLAWEQLALPRLLDRWRPDVHHGPHYTMPERAHVPVVVTVHDMTFFDHPEWHERAKVPVFRRAIARAAERAAAVICISETTAARFRDRFPSAPPVFVAPMGVDLQRFTSTADPADAEALTAMGIRGRYVAFLGTLEPRKDIGTLVRAFDAVAGAHPDLSLVVAGRDGWGDSGLAPALADATHRDRVRRIGYVALDHVPALLRNAVAVVYPTLDEGFGIPVLEAMACGAPVVTTAGTVMEEVAGDGALLVSPRDVDGFAAAIEAIATDHAGVDDLCRRGVARASAFTWQHCAIRHVDAYRSVG
jgi:glycosyltransferase involved in cell wall biosynthesis